MVHPIGLLTLVNGKWQGSALSVVERRSVRMWPGSDHREIGEIASSFGGIAWTIMTS